MLSPAYPHRSLVDAGTSCSIQLKIRQGASQLVQVTQKVYALFESNGDENVGVTCRNSHVPDATVVNYVNKRGIGIR